MRGGSPMLMDPHHSQQNAGAYFINIFLHNLQPNCYKLQNCINLSGRLRSKLCRNYESVNFYGIVHRSLNLNFAQQTISCFTKGYTDTLFHTTKFS